MVRKAKKKRNRENLTKMFLNQGENSYDFG